MLWSDIFFASAVSYKILCYIEKCQLTFSLPFNKLQYGKRKICNNKYVYQYLHSSLVFDCIFRWPLESWEYSEVCSFIIARVLPLKIPIVFHSNALVELKATYPDCVSNFPILVHWNPETKIIIEKSCVL